MLRVGIVCGYGVPIDENQRRYVDGVVAAAERFDLRVLILSGGPTSSGTTETEAAVMRRLIGERLGTRMLLLEEQALTTLHNLRFSRALIGRLDRAPDELVILCDPPRHLKVVLLAKIELRGFPTRVVSIYRHEPIRVYLVQIPSTVAQLVAALSSKAERKLLEQRARRRQEQR